MYTFLKESERKKIEKIDSRLHGPDYLSRDLKFILEELKILLKIKEAIVIVKDGDIEAKEFLGEANIFWDKYELEFRDLIKISFEDRKYVIRENLNQDISRILVIPIIENLEFLGAILIINKKINYGNNDNNTEIIELLESQIAFSLKKTNEVEKIFKLFSHYLDKRQIISIIDNPEFLMKPQIIDSV